jgi:hypothetical protein
MDKLFVSTLSLVAYKCNMGSYSACKQWKNYLVGNFTFNTIDSSFWHSNDV